MPAEIQSANSVPSSSLFFSEKKSDPTYTRLSHVLTDWKEKTDQCAQNLTSAKPWELKEIIYVSTTKQKNLYDQFIAEAKKTLPSDIDDYEFEQQALKLFFLFKRSIYDTQQLCRKVLQGKEGSINKEATLWLNFGLPAELLDTYPEFVQFLKDSKLLFLIQAHRKCSHDPNLKEGIKIDEDGHPMLLKEGVWTRWENFKELFEYDSYLEQIYSKQDHKQLWSYRFPNGLVPFQPKQKLEPIHQLSKKEMDRLKEHSAEFLKKNGDPNPNEEKPCFIQFFTTKRDLGVSKNFFLRILFKNLETEFSHVGCRYIDHEGNVYSFGLISNYHSEQMRNGFHFPSFLTTSDIDETPLDFDEVRPFEKRHVTTIPLMKKNGDAVLEHFYEMRTTKHLRLNFGKQNCTRFSIELLRAAGYDVDVRMKLSGIVWRILPGLEDIPLVGSLLHRIAKVVKSIFGFTTSLVPNFIKTLAYWTFLVITYIPSKIFTMFRNIIILAAGGARAATPLPEGIEDNRNNDEKITSFERLFSHWTDIFNEDIGVTYWPGEFMRWQNELPSTHTHVYSGSPNLYIVPPLAR